MKEEILKDIEDFSKRWDGKDDYPGNEFETIVTLTGYDDNPNLNDVLKSPIIPEISIHIHLYDDASNLAHFMSTVYPKYSERQIYKSENPEASKQFFEITKKIHNHLINLYSKDK